MIYVVIPGNAVTGGPETLHQVADELKRLGNQVKVVYRYPNSMDIPDRYKKYDISLAEEIQDSEQNWLIFPETMTHFVYKYKKIRKCIMWLSLDFFLDSAPNRMVCKRLRVRGLPKLFYPIVFIHKMREGKLHLRQYKFDDANTVLHGYNCEYVHQYLLDKGINDKNTLYICGPIGENYLNLKENPYDVQRENLIVYNPKKGIEFTNTLIEKAKNSGINGQFVPLANMTPEEIEILFCKAKVYMDFGEFPGPERIPREAVICHCNIITSLNGSANNAEDVPIPDCMKFDTDVNNIDSIIEKIRDMLENYVKYCEYYDQYREKVKKQPLLFKQNILALSELLKL